MSAARKRPGFHASNTFFRRKRRRLCFYVCEVHLRRRTRTRRKIFDGLFRQKIFVSSAAGMWASHLESHAGVAGSTRAPCAEAVERCAAVGVRYVQAAVSGGAPQAACGQLHLWIAPGPVPPPGGRVSSSRRIARVYGIPATLIAAPHGVMFWVKSRVMSRVQSRERRGEAHFPRRRLRCTRTPDSALSCTHLPCGGVAAKPSMNGRHPRSRACDVGPIGGRMMKDKKQKKTPPSKRRPAVRTRKVRLERINPSRLTSQP